MTREQIKKIVRLTESIVNNRLNEFGAPLTGSGNKDELDQYKRDASKKSERGESVYVVKTKSGGYKLSKYYEKGNTEAGYYNGIQQSLDESRKLQGRRLNENGSYYRTEFSKISAAPGPTQPKIQITDEHAKTKWIDLNNDSVPELIGWLQRTF